MNIENAIVSGRKRAVAALGPAAYCDACGPASVGDLRGPRSTLRSPSATPAPGRPPPTAPGTTRIITPMNIITLCKQVGPNGRQKAADQRVADDRQREDRQADQIDPC